MSLQIGYAQQTITPALDRPVYLAGFGRNRRAQTVHDDLYVRALGLQLGDTRLVLAALDLLGLSRRHCQAIERRINGPAPGTRLILACTHTHHAPDTIGLWGPDTSTSGVDHDYIGALKATVADTALAALDQRRPARMRSTSAHVPGVARNARDPHIVDDELTCLQFDAETDGATIATLLIFPCHPEVLWDDNPHITSDYVHYLRREVEAETGAACLFFAGALGGMMTPDVQQHDFEAAENMGKRLAEAAVAALSPAQATNVTGLDHRVREFSTPVTNPVFHMAVEAGLLTDPWIEMGKVTTEANLLKIGSTWLAGVPGELLPQLGLALKDQLRAAGAQTAGVIGLANDELGYILPAEDFVYPEDPLDPGEHYEETMSVGPEIGPDLMQAIYTINT